MAQFSNAMEIFRFLPKNNCRECGEKKDSNPIEEEVDEVMKKLQHRILSLDLKERSNTIKAEYKEGALTLSTLGKPFHIDRYCNVTTDIHVNNWVLGSTLHCSFWI